MGIDMAKLDDLFDEAAGSKRLRDLSEEELLRREFTAQDPESLEGVSKTIPEGEEPEVEFGYDMKGRAEMVECVYCGYPNHYKGIVVRYPSGVRNLVGRDCALTHHGVNFERQLIEFDAAVERQSYARRRLHLLDASVQVLRGLTDLRADPAVTTYDQALRRWREHLRELAVAVANVARRDDQQRLVLERVVRDFDGEKARAARLGPRLAEEKQRAKDAGEQWQLFRHETEDLGPLQGRLFFRGGIDVAKRLDEIQGQVQKAFHMLSVSGVSTAQIRRGLRTLSDLRDALSHELDRLEALAEAFDPANLARIARWANEQEADRIRREAEEDQRKVPPIRDRFLAQGRSIKDRRYNLDVCVSIPDVYRAPKRTILDLLKDATSVEFEPRPPAKAA